MKIGRREFIFSKMSLPFSLNFITAPLATLLARCSSSNRSEGVTSCDAIGVENTDISTNSSNNLMLCLNTYTDLKNLHGSYRLTVHAATGEHTISVTRISATEVVAINAICTHQGCTIGKYSSAARTYTCPCHGSIYNADGTVNSGPAPKSLTTYPVALNDGDVTVFIP